MRVTAALRRAEQVNAGGTAIEFGERISTWGEVAERVRKMAGALAGLGLEAGDRVAILANNSDRYLEYYFFVPWAGGVVVPLNTRWAAPENIYALNDSGSTILFVDDDFAPMLAAFEGRLESVKTVIHMGDGPAPAGALSYESLLAAAEPAADAERHDGDLYGIFYTGGTTGTSKGVMLSHGNIVANMLNVLASLDYKDDDCWLHAAPMFHLADGSSILGLTARAARHAIIPKFEPVAAMQAIERHRVTYCLFVPTMLNMLVNHPQVGDFDLTSVRRVLYGASPMPIAVLEQAMVTLKGWEFIQGYGMTELSPLTTTLEWKFHEVDGPNAGRLASCGRAVTGVEVGVFDENGVPCPAGTIGEICSRGPHVMQGYWNKPDLTAAAIREGWMRTGDAGYMDEDGFFYLVDRVKDMIVSGGENVYSAEVEQAVYQHDAVAECAVIGIPDEKWGEAVHAIVVLKPGQTLDEAALIGHCHSLIAGYKCPRSVRFVDGPLPLSGAGKILKTELRKPYWEGRERDIN